jgi:hypothetical protein
MSLLSDGELNWLSTLAEALPLPFRHEFLRSVAAKLSTVPELARGPGLVYRLGIEAQRSILKGGCIAAGAPGKARRSKCNDGVSRNLRRPAVGR